LNNKGIVDAIAVDTIPFKIKKVILASLEAITRSAVFFYKQEGRIL
jgi:hypothetical protein